MEEKYIRYKWNGESFLVPESNSASIEKHYPDAEIEMHMDGETFNVPLQYKQGYLDKYGSKLSYFTNENNTPKSTSVPLETTETEVNTAVKKDDKDNKDKTTVGESLGKGLLASALAPVRAALINLPQQLTAGMLYNDPMTGEAKRLPDYDTQQKDDTNAFTRASKESRELNERLSREADPTENGEGFIDLILDGKFGKALQKGLATTAESSVTTLAARNPYTMFANMVFIAANNYAEQTQDNPNIPAWKRAAYAIGSAAWEQTVEKLSDPVFKYLGGGKAADITEEVAKEFIENGAKDAVQNIAKRIFKGIGKVGKNIVKDAGGEGLEEVATNFGNDALGTALDAVDGDKDYGITAQWEQYKSQNPDADLWDFSVAKAKEYGDAFIGGAMSGGYMAGGAQALGGGIKSYSEFKGRNNLQNARQYGSSMNMVDLYDTDTNVNEDIANAVETFTNESGESDLSAEFISGLSSEDAFLLSRNEDLTPEQRQAMYRLSIDKSIQEGLVGSLDERLESEITANKILIEKASQDGKLVSGQHNGRLVYVEGVVTKKDAVKLPDGKNGPVKIYDAITGEQSIVNSKEITRAITNETETVTSNIDALIREDEAKRREVARTTMSPRAKTKAVLPYARKKILIDVGNGITEVFVEKISDKGEVMIKGKKGDLGGQSILTMSASTFYDSIYRDDDGNPVVTEVEQGAEEEVTEPTEEAPVAETTGEEDYRGYEGQILINGRLIDVTDTQQDNQSNTVNYTYVDENGNMRVGSTTIQEFGAAIKQAEEQTKNSAPTPKPAPVETPEPVVNEPTPTPEPAPEGTTEETDWDALFENDTVAFYDEVKKQFGDKAMDFLNMEIQATQNEISSLEKNMGKTTNERAKNFSKLASLRLKLGSLNEMAELLERQSNTVAKTPTETTTDAPTETPIEVTTEVPTEPVDETPTETTEEIPTEPETEEQNPSDSQGNSVPLNLEQSVEDNGEHGNKQLGGTIRQSGDSGVHGADNERGQDSDNGNQERSKQTSENLEGESKYDLDEKYPFRKGNATQKLLIDTFGFESVTIPNSRKDTLNSIYDFMMEMAKVLGISPKSIGHGGELKVANLRANSIAVAKHNLEYNTRTGDVIKSELLYKYSVLKGIAHEWFHSLDYVLSYFNTGKYLNKYGFEIGPTSEISDIDFTGRKETLDAIRDVVKAIEQYGHRERIISYRPKNLKYWISQREMIARSFEEYIKMKFEDAGIVVSGSEFTSFDGQPTAEEMNIIGPAFDNLFKVLQEKEGKTPGTSVLYHIGEAMAQNDEVKSQLGELVANWIQDGGNFVVIDDVAMQNALAENDNARTLETPDGSVYGFVKDGVVYLNPSLLNPNTSIHEYTHLWDNALMQMNPALWEKGKALMKQTPIWNEVINDPNYADIKDNEDLVASEVHSRLVGTKGAERLNQLEQEARAKGLTKGAKEVSILGRLREWINEATQWLKDAFSKWTESELDSVTLSDFINMPLRDLANTKKLQTEGTITNANGEIVANANGKGQIQFSIRTWRDGGRDYLSNWLKNDKTLTKQEKEDILARMDEFYENAQKYTDVYVPFGSWSEAAVKYDENGNPLMSVIKKNGDYSMNLDFSLVCKKRRPLNKLLRTLINRNAFGTYSLRERELAEINWILQEHGFEVACALCFVDAKRYRVTGVADVFAQLYNRFVTALAPEGTQIAHFNYSNNPNIESVENGLDTLSDEQLNWDKFNELANQYEPTTVEGKVAKFLRENPSQRRLVDATDFIDASGFEAVKEGNPALLSLYNSKKGTGGPKASFGDVQYLNDILKKSRSFTAGRAYDVGGVRLQSFSDFVPHMYFDYMQLFAELTAKKLPAHAYTKEVLFAKIFGLTGLKINMSLVPAVVEGGIAPGLDANGNYAWADAVKDKDGNIIQQAQSFPFDEAMAIQNAEGYSKNCGVIAVGISDEHIEKMLNDPNIPFIIPYHKSSLNAIVARMTNIDQYKDYTNVQNTKKADGTKLDEGARDFNFNAWLRKNKGATPKDAAQAYLDWCKKNNYRPKFSQFAYHPNYYKLLVDFNTVDARTGEYTPQGAVTMTFPTGNNAFGDVETLIQQGLQEDAELEEKMDSEIEEVANEVEQRLAEIKNEPEMSEKEYADKMAELADERMARIKEKAEDDGILSRSGDVTPEDIRNEKAAIKEKSVADGTFMKAPNGEPTNLTEDQWLTVRTESFKNWFGDWENDPKNASKVVDKNGEPQVVYHGSPYGAITEFDRRGHSVSGLREFGTYFSTSKELAQLYAYARQQAKGDIEKYETEKYRLDAIIFNNETPARVALDAFDELDRLEESQKPKVYEVFLNIREPKVFDAERSNGWDGWHKLKQDVGYDIKSGVEAIEAIAGHNSAARMDKKYDGIIAQNMADVHSEATEDLMGDVFLVFDETPANIKSATSNIGTFDPENQDIRYRRSTPVEFHQLEVDNFLSKYNPDCEVTVYPVNEKTAKMFGYTLEQLKNRHGRYLPSYDFIAIFAREDITDGQEIEETLFHESIHKLVQFSANEYMVSAGKWMFDNASTEEMLSDYKKKIEENYADRSEVVKHEEMLAHVLSGAMRHGGTEALMSIVPSDSKRIINEILNAIRYESKAESERRIRETLSQSSVAEDVSESGSENAGQGSRRGYAGATGRPENAESGRRVTVENQNAAVSLHTGETRNGIIERAASEEAQKLGVNVTFAKRSDMAKGHETDKGYYNTKTGEIVICPENNASIADAIQTILHEAVAHKGLRQLMGDKFDEFISRVYDSLDDETKAKVDKLAEDHYKGNKAVAMEEYMASLAENENFAENSVWDKIKSIFEKIINSILDRDDIKIGDNELRYILRASYANMVNPRNMDTIEGWAKDTNMREEYKINKSTPEILSRTGIDPTEVSRETARTTYDKVVNDNWQEFQRQFQDAMQPVRIAIDAIQQETGNIPIEDYENYILIQNHASSRSRVEIDEFERRYFGPIIDKVNEVITAYIKATGGNVNNEKQRAAVYQMIKNYLIAKHGLERNKYYQLTNKRKLNRSEKDKEEKRVIKEYEDKVNNINLDDTLSDVEKELEIRKAADELNAKKTEIAERTVPDLRDYSGLTALFGFPSKQYKEAEEEARKYVADIEKKLGRVDNEDGTVVTESPILTDMWNKIKSATDKTLRHSYECGLLSRSQYEEIKDMFAYYIPLRGFDETTAEDVYSYARFKGNEFNPAVYKAGGRTSLANDPIAIIMNMAESEIAQGNKNRAKQALYNFLLNRSAGNKDQNSLMQIESVWYLVNYDDAGNEYFTIAAPNHEKGETYEEFEEKMLALEEEKKAFKSKKGKVDVGMRFQKQMDRNSHYVYLKVNGVEKAIYINGNPKAADAINGTYYPKSNAVVDKVKDINRFISSTFTNYSLSFTARNFIRDAIYSRINMSIRESDPAYRKKFRQNYWHAFGNMRKLIKAYRNGELDGRDLNPDEAAFVEFMRNGGQTGYTVINSVENHKKELERAIKRMQRGTYNGGGKSGFMVMFKWIELMNESSELLTRFVAYKTSRDMGRGIETSIGNAKEITVNFNTRGAQDGTGILGGVARYFGWSKYFFNASVQGVQNLKSMAESNKIKFCATVGGMIGFGFAMPLIHALATLWGDDDENEYWNIPEYDRQNNICIQVFGTYIKIPLPIGFREMYAIGDTMAAALCDKKFSRDLSQMGMDMANKVASIVLPINPLESAANGLGLWQTGAYAILPSGTQFAIQNMTNIDWKGAPLQKEYTYNEHDPQWTKAFASNPKWMTGLSKWCNENINLDGDFDGMDWSPEKLDNTLSNVFGGMYSLVKQFGRTVSTALSEDKDFNMMSVPLVGVVLSSGIDDDDRFVTDTYYDMKEYYDKNVNSIKRTAKTFGYDLKEVFNGKNVGAHHPKMQRIYSNSNFDFMQEWYIGNKELESLKNKIEYREKKIAGMDKVPNELIDEIADLKNKLENERREFVNDMLELD